MKPILALFAALTAVLVAVPSAPADTCHNPAVQVVTPAVVATLVLPLYGAAYTGAGSGADETNDLLKRLLQEMKEMRQDLAALSRPVGTLAEKAGPDVFQVFRAACVSCHSGDKPRGDFALVSAEGKFLRLSPADRRSVLDRIGRPAAGRMPPAGKGPDGKDRPALTPAEVQAVKRALADAPAGPGPR